MQFVLIFMLILSACTSNKDSKSETNSPIPQETALFELERAAYVFVVAENIKITPTLHTSMAKAFSITPALPLGVTLNKVSGEISGVGVIEQVRTRYTLTLEKSDGLSYQKEFYLEIKKDLTLASMSILEVTTASGPSFDLKPLVQYGKGNYVYALTDPTVGSLSGSVFTPSDKVGETTVLVKDDSGRGTQVALVIKVGVPRVQVSQYDPREGEIAKVTLILSGKTSQPSSVNYDVTLDTAYPSTVTAQSGQKVLQPGQTTLEIQIPTFNNGVYKTDTSFSVTVTLDQNLKFADSELSQKTLHLIVQNQVPRPKISFKQTDISFIEADENLSLSLVLDRPSLVPIKVVLSLDKNISTVKAVDYSFSDQTVIFNPNQTEVSLPVQLFHDRNGNLPQDPDRLMSFLLSNPEIGRLSDQTRMNVLLRDPVMVIIDSAMIDFVLLNALSAKNWNQTQDVIVRILPGGLLSSSSATKAAFSSGFIPVNTPSHIVLENHGQILGAPGQGGKAGDPLDPVFNGVCQAHVAGKKGQAGGDAVNVVMPLVIENYGTISGGPGGGGGGTSAIITDINCLNSQVFYGSDGAAGYQTALPAESQSPYVSAGGAGGGAMAQVGFAAEDVLELLGPFTKALGGEAGKAVASSSLSLVLLNNHGGTVKP